MSNPTPDGSLPVGKEEQLARHLYDTFWLRADPQKPAPTWSEQAEAIKAMWRNIANDAFGFLTPPADGAPLGEEE